MEIATYFSLILSLCAIAFAAYVYIQSKKTKEQIDTILGVGSEKLSDGVKKAYSDIEKTVQMAAGIQINVNDLIAHQRNHLQKISLYKYNPYQDTGGNLSFVLVLLNAENDGILINSLHNRDITRIYSKSVKSGKIDGNASQEEDEAIKKALSQ